MTKEDRELLLRDLCARLPYGVMCTHTEKIPQWFIKEYNCTVEDSIVKYKLDYKNFCFTVGNIDYIKPYLRPVSSMTDEEKKEIKDYINSIEGQLIGFGGRVIWLNDYYLSHHIDTRGMINKGLALEATEGMYNL